MSPEMQNSAGIEQALVTIAQAIQNGDDLANIRFSVGRAAAWTPTAGAISTIPFDTIEYDPSSSWVAGTFRFVAPVSGLYHFSGMASSVGTGTAFVVLQKNGSDYRRGARDGNNNNNYYPISVDVPLAKGDYVSLCLYVSNGAIEAGASINYFQGHIVRKV